MKYIANHIQIIEIIQSRIITGDAGRGKSTVLQPYTSWHHFLGTAPSNSSDATSTTILSPESPSISLSQLQIASLLANAFLSTFPYRTSRSESVNHPHINFSGYSIPIKISVRHIFHEDVFILGYLKIMVIETQWWLRRSDVFWIILIELLPKVTNVYQHMNKLY